MLDTTLGLAQITGWSAILVLPDTGSVAVWGLLITAVATLIKQFLDKRDARLDRDQQHKFENEASADRTKLQHLINENTVLTLATKHATDLVTKQVEEVGVRADKAYEAGNNVGQKFAQLAAAALVQDRATERTSTAAIRDDISKIS